MKDLSPSSHRNLKEQLSPILTSHPQETLADTEGISLRESCQQSELTKDNIEMDYGPDA